MDTNKIAPIVETYATMKGLDLDKLNKLFYRHIDRIKEAVQKNVPLHRLLNELLQNTTENEFDLDTTTGFLTTVYTQVGVEHKLSQLVVQQDESGKVNVTKVSEDMSMLTKVAIGVAIGTAVAVGAYLLLRDDGTVETVVEPVGELLAA